jgi:glucosamine-6-phosphate deaminase
MHLISAADYRGLSDHAAAMVIDRLQQNPRLVLGLATGSTPIGLYQRLVKAFQTSQVNFTGVTTFNLDEYCRLDVKHPQSYHSFMADNFFSHINLPKSGQHFPSCLPGRQSYDQLIAAAGGIDLQILGLGRNGHIGFNEPGSDFNSETRVVALSPTTVADNARFFSSPADVPRKAVTMGLRTIIAAAEILLLVSGTAKQSALAAALKGPISTGIPASLLQRHPRVTVIADQQALSRELI